MFCNCRHRRHCDLRVKEEYTNRKGFCLQSEPVIYLVYIVFPFTNTNNLIAFSFLLPASSVVFLTPSIALCACLCLLDPGHCLWRTPAPTEVFGKGEKRAVGSLIYKPEQGKA